METRKLGYWNIWWTLTLISAAFTVAVAILEALGIIREVGEVLGILGLVLSMVFGLTASTRSSLRQFRAEVAPRVDRLDERLGQVDSRLGQVDSRLAQMDSRLAQMTDRLDRIVTILDERLPHPAA